MSKSKVNIAVLGAGNIGSAVIERLLTIDNTLLNLTLKKVLVSDVSKDRNIDKSLLTDNFDEILNDKEIDVVIEVLGGIDPGKAYIKSSLSSGKSVIIELAQENKTNLYFEAAVAAGIPVLKPLIESLRAEELTRVSGIINGTSNYILTAMEEGSSYEDALREAQELGYAEPDPTNDVEGIDAQYKAIILSMICFGATPTTDEVFTKGISEITKDDFSWAKRVTPVLLDIKHPLASIRGALNAVVVEGESINQLVFSGPGAGAAPTASAIIGDVLSVCHQINNELSNWYPLRENQHGEKAFEKVLSSWFLRLSVADEPGVLAEIAGTLGENSVSIESVIQEGRGDEAELVLITHEAPEKALKTSLVQLTALSSVSNITSTLRVYS